MNGGVPAVVVVIALGGPVAIMVLLMLWAVPRRRRGSRPAAGVLAGRARGVRPGSAAGPADAGQIPSQNLLEALAVAPEEHGPAGAMPDVEEVMGIRLGLRARAPGDSEVLEPHVYWGVRLGREVLIRTGPDEEIEGGTVLYSNRHIRSLTVVRVHAPEFEVTGEDGVLRVEEYPVPDGVSAAVNSLSRSPRVWRDLRVAGGAEGLVAARPAVDDVLDLWLYDLWLLERIADLLDAPALPPAPVGPGFRIPYNLGRSTRVRRLSARPAAGIDSPTGHKRGWEDDMAHSGAKAPPPAELIDRRIAELGDWRGDTLATVRALIREVDPGVVEEWKWKGTPVWSHDGIICTGEHYAGKVKLTFARGASLDDPAGLFTSSLDGRVRRAIDIHEGEALDPDAFRALVRAAIDLNTSR